MKRKKNKSIYRKKLFFLVNQISLKKPIFSNIFEQFGDFSRVKTTNFGDFSRVKQKKKRFYNSPNSFKTV